MKSFYVPNLATEPSRRVERDARPRLKTTLPPLLILGLIPFVSPLSSNIHIPSLPTMARELGVDLASTQLTITVYMLGFAIGLLFVGLLSDSLGKRRVLLAALGVCSAACLLAACAPSMEVLLIARLLQATGASAAVVIPYAKIQEMLTGRALTKAMAIVSVYHSLSAALAPLVGGVLAYGPGWRVGFLLTGLFCIVLINGVSKTFWTDYFRRRPPVAPSHLIDRFKKLLGSPIFLSCLLVQSSLGGAYYATFAAAPAFFVVNLKLTELACGLILCLFCAFFTLGSYLAPMLNEHAGQQSAIATGILTSCAGMVPFLFSPCLSLIGILAAISFYAIGTGIVSPLVLTAATRDDPALSANTCSLIFSTQVLIGAASAWFVTYMDLSRPFDFASFSLSLSLVALLAVFPQFRSKRKWKISRS